jgi:hypothetical protein
VVAGHDLLDVLGQVVPQVEAVRDLDRVWCSGAGAFGVGAGPVPADHLNPGMRPQPLGEGGGLPVGQHIDRPVGVHIDEHCAVDVPSADREVADPEDPYRYRRAVRQPADQPQHRVPADRHSEPGRQPRPGPTGQGQPDLFQHLMQATATAGIRHGQALDLLGEPTHRTALVLTDEHPNPQHEHQLPPAYRQIGQPALVTAVHPRATSATPDTVPDRPSA